MLLDDAHRYMQLALEDAARGLYTTTPNPRVGCVLVKAGHIIGRGWTQPAGQNHAEIEAIQNARAQGHDPQGAMAYVTLEPCSHIGRTSACAQALIDAGIQGVVAAMEDPNPLVRGRGFALLRDAGLAVHCGVLEEQARELNLGFITRMTQQRPWVRAKMATSLDGKTALPHGESQWITGQVARTDGHAWRARACAVLTGIGTIKQDDPQLSVREVSTTRQPQRIVIDPRLEISLTARILRPTSPSDAPTLIICASPGFLHTPKAHALHEAGVELIAFQKTVRTLERHTGERPLSSPSREASATKATEPPTPREWVQFGEHHAICSTLISTQGPLSHIPLPSLLTLLASRGVNELHVEAGARLNGAFWQAGCIDELLLYIAPTFLYQGMSLLDLPSLATLPVEPHLTFQSVVHLGTDLRVIARANRSASAVRKSGPVVA